MQGAIVYSGIQNLVVNDYTGESIDFDGDTVSEFTVFYTGKEVRSRSNDSGDQMVVDSFDVVKLPSGSEISGSAIGGSATFESDVSSGFYIAGGSGEWGPSDSGFMGVRFNIDSDQHYGWVQITAQSSNQVTLVDWAYETNAGEGINAGEGASIPEPGMTTLGLAATALSAIVFKRFRRKSKPAA